MYTQRCKSIHLGKRITTLIRCSNSPLNQTTIIMGRPNGKNERRLLYSENEEGGEKHPLSERNLEGVTGNSRKKPLYNDATGAAVC